MVLKMIFPCLLILLFQKYCSAQNVVAPDQPDIAITVHNNYRRLQNSSNMKALQWDQALADAASSHAINCDYNFDPNSRDGESIYVTGDTYTAEILEKAVTSWYNQKDDYDLSTDICSTSCSRYLQVVWANSHRIGCAVASCSSITNAFDDNGGGTLVICRYSPRGNVVGERPMRKGESCSECDLEWFCDDGLCVPEAAASKPGSSAEPASVTVGVTSTAVDTSENSTQQPETDSELPPTIVGVVSTAAATAFTAPSPKTTAAKSSWEDTTIAGPTTAESPSFTTSPSQKSCSEEYAEMLRNYKALMNNYKKEVKNWKEMTSTNSCFKND